MNTCEIAGNKDRSPLYSSETIILPKTKRRLLTKTDWK